jgi:cation transport ATPase
MEAQLSGCQTKNDYRKRMTISDPELDDRSYSHLLTLLSVSAAMVGVCLTAVGLVSVIAALNKIEIWVDELLATGSLVFSIVTLLSFLGIRTRIRRWKRFTLVLDVLFCVGISAMVVASMLLTYYVI